MLFWKLSDLKLLALQFFCQGHSVRWYRSPCPFLLYPQPASLPSHNVKIVGNVKTPKNVDGYLKANYFEVSNNTGKPSQYHRCYLTSHSNFWYRKKLPRCSSIYLSNSQRHNLLWFTRTTFHICPQCYALPLKNLLLCFKEKLSDLKLLSKPTTAWCGKIIQCFNTY